MSVLSGRGAGASAKEVKGAASLLSLVGGVFIWGAVPVTLIVFTGPKMVAEPGGLSMEEISSGQSMYWIGWALASVVFMPKLDRFGRHAPAYIFLVGGIVAAFASTCITTAWSYALSLFFMGVCLPTSSMLTYLLLTESVPAWFKPMVGTSLNAGFSLCEALIAVFCARPAAHQMDWRTETRLWYSPYVLFLIIGIFYVRDPPKQVEDHLEVAAVEARAEAGISRVLKPGMRITTVATCLCWSAASVSYYGLNYAAGSLSPNVYVNMLLLGLIDMMGYILAVGIIEPFGPRRAQIGSFFIAGLALFVCGILPSGWMLMACALVGRFFVNVAFATCYLLLVTCFPVESRGSASGLANFFARLSSLVAPFCNLLPTGICCTFLGLLVLAAAGATTALSEMDAVGSEEDKLAEPWLRTDCGVVEPNTLEDKDLQSFLTRL